MLCVLLQSLLGIPDETIIDDYFQSNQMIKNISKGSAAATEAIRKRGGLDRTIFSGTNRQAIETTLIFLRTKYGTVSPGYLDAICFDEGWRKRIRAVLRTPRSHL